MNYLDICREMPEIPVFTPSKHVKELVKRNKSPTKILTSKDDTLAHKFDPNTIMLDIDNIPPDVIGLIEQPHHIKVVEYIKGGFEYYLMTHTTSHIHISGNLYLLNIQLSEDLYTIVYVTFQSHESSIYSIHYSCDISYIPSKYYNQVSYNHDIGSFSTKSIGAVTDTIVNELNGTSIIEKTICYNFILVHITSKSSRDVRCHGYFINGRIVIKKIAFSERGANSFEVNKPYFKTTKRIMVESKSFNVNEYDAMINYVKY